MSTNVFPISLYEELLPKLVAVLELTQQDAGMSNPQAKQKLLQATNNFKAAIAQAKDFAINLPGGELVIEEQDDVINMLDTLKERKRQVVSSDHPFAVVLILDKLRRTQLAEFAAKKVISSSSDMKMEVDSVASTPARSTSDG
ncbi:hypothetical protein BDZ97DRAFT_1649490 [Flammula alnicola]|nr:hypothetical protein BDZ97DRAFT_1649490 [Flammula alnicola]